MTEYDFPIWTAILFLQRSVRFYFLEDNELFLQVSWSTWKKMSVDYTINFV